MSTWDLEKVKAHIIICNGSCCRRNQGEGVTAAIRTAIKEQKLEKYIHTSRTQCNGRCNYTTNVVVYPEGTWYEKITPEDAEKLVTMIGQGKKLKEKISHIFHEGTFKRYRLTHI